MRGPKESPWKLSEPASFRRWLKGTMKPMGYDKALNRKKNVAVAYFFASFLTLNTVLWSFSKRKEIVPQVTPEHEGEDYFLTIEPEFRIIFCNTFEFFYSYGRIFDNNTPK